MALQSFFSGLKSELAHVVWPDAQTAIRSTVFVVLISFLVGYYLGLWDALFAWVLKVVLS
jgi:preprotein translocase SecE subunit